MSYRENSAPIAPDIVRCSLCGHVHDGGDFDFYFSDSSICYAAARIEDRLRNAGVSTQEAMMHIRRMWPFPIKISG